ncbi:MAG: hypothetical protein LBD01_05435 [Puniceicoccales bacterium]|jgi:tetratricopeptide (TPR) repeat protein|nr:hypothetical protein [Puniceicoccales bacterium]
MPSTDPRAYWIALLVALATILPARSATPPPSSAPPQQLSPAEAAAAKTLSEILDDQKKLLESLQSDETKHLSKSEKEQRILSIAKRYEAMLGKRPDDPTAMIFYGKFLRLVDAREEANRWFLKADALAPKLAVIKHQLGVYAAEEGRIVAALDLLETATQLEPRTAIYHYHFGEFLATYNKLIAHDKLLSREACDARMQDAFRSATELAPTEITYLWRHAQSFFDCEKPNWFKALTAWERLAPKLKTPREHEVLGLYKARVLIELGRSSEAKQLVDASKSPELETSRTRLRALLPNAP